MTNRIETHIDDQVLNTADVEREGAQFIRRRITLREVR